MQAQAAAVIAWNRGGQDGGSGEEKGERREQSREKRGEQGEEQGEERGAEKRAERGEERGAERRAEREEERRERNGEKNREKNAVWMVRDIRFETDQIDCFGSYAGCSSGFALRLFGNGGLGIGQCLQFFQLMLQGLAFI